MKLEIEVSESDIKSAIERKVRVAVAEYGNSFYSEAYIKDAIKKHWQDAVDSMIKEALADSDALREKINKALENKIKAQLQAVINKTKV